MRRALLGAAVLVAVALSGCTNWHREYDQEKVILRSTTCQYAQREVEIDQHLKTLGIARAIFEQTPTLPRECRQVTH